LFYRFFLTARVTDFSSGSKREGSSERREHMSSSQEVPEVPAGEGRESRPLPSVVFPVHARCPVNREQLSEYLCEVWDLQEDFNVRVPYHGTLEGLQEDALTWFWNFECQEELDNVVQATSLPFTVQPGEVQDYIVCNCCPHGAHVGIDDSAWVSSEESQVDGYDGWACVPDP
jgi:hypothetical protein